MRFADLWRRAAGVADYVGQGAPGRHFGRWLCLNCPRDHHEPPFLPFGLQLHIREHWQGFPDHVIAWWCWDHVQVEMAYQVGWRWIDHPSLNGDLPQQEEAPMCTFRRVKVTWPDGRSIKLIVEENGTGAKSCSVCDLSEAGFRRRYLVPHDDLGHQELYHGAKVSRGRRLSPEQAAAIRRVQAAEDPEGKPWQPSMPGVLVDVGVTS